MSPYIFYKRNFNIKRRKKSKTITTIVTITLRITMSDPTKRGKESQVKTTCPVSVFTLGTSSEETPGVLREVRHLIRGLFEGDSPSTPGIPQVKI